MVSFKALEESRPEWDCTASILQLITDLKNIEYFMTEKLLNQKQTSWAGLFIRFDYHILYRPEKSNGTADALTSRLGDIC